MKFVWEWPQITWAVLAGIGLLWAAVNDGEPRTGKHSIGVSLFCAMIAVAILYFGGFFTEVRP